MALWSASILIKAAIINMLRRLLSLKSLCITFIVLLVLGTSCCSLHWKPKADSISGQLYVSTEWNGSILIPTHWKQVHSDNHLFFNETQWCNAVEDTGVGVVYITAPIPLSNAFLIKYTKSNYQDSSGKVFHIHNDNQGRAWFEAETHDYYAKGFSFCCGRHAWIVYSGYRKVKPPPLTDFDKAYTSVLSFKTQ